MAGLSAVNAFAVTVSVAVLLVAPVPPFVELTAPVVLSFPPADVAVTSTEMLHDRPAGIDPLLRLITPLPAVAPVNVPLHVLLAFGVLATCTPAGSVSLTADARQRRPRVRVGDGQAQRGGPADRDAGGRDRLPTVGGPATVSVAVLLVAPVPPLVELGWPRWYCPSRRLEVAVTSTEMLHVSPARIDPPLKLIAPLPAVAPVNVPLHVLVAISGVLATCTPAGSVSLTATPASAVPGFGLVMVKLSVEVPRRPRCWWA